jgi:hypothetical protein
MKIESEDDTCQHFGMNDVESGERALQQEELQGLLANF